MKVFEHQQVLGMGDGFFPGLAGIARLFPAPELPSKEKEGCSAEKYFSVMSLHVTGRTEVSAQLEFAQGACTCAQR